MAKDPRTRVRNHTVLETFLESKPGKRGAGCGTCALGAVIAQPIELFLAKQQQSREAGRMTHSLRGFHRILKEHYDYPYGTDALNKHITRCIGGTD